MCSFVPCACNGPPLRGECLGTCWDLADATRAVALEHMKCCGTLGAFFSRYLACFLVKWHLLPVSSCLIQSREADDESLF